MEDSFEDANGAHASATPDNFSRSSPAPQKRARDYGEELKGLSSSGDEANPPKQSTPPLKRRKIRYNSAADGGSGSDTEGLDDGEIVESPAPSPVIRPVSTENQSQDDMQPQTLNTSNGPASVSSEDGEIITSLGAGEVSRQAQESIEGAGSRESQEYEQPSAAINQHSQVPLLGWNHGIQLGRRTTFGTRPVKPLFGKPATALKTTEEDQEQQNNKDEKPVNSFFGKPPPAIMAAEEEQEQQNKKEKKRVRSRDPVSSFEASNVTWNFPLSAPEITVPDDVSEKSEFWVTVLRKWIVHLIQANGETAERLTYKVIRSGWPLYFTKKMGFVQGTKKQIIAARLVAQNFMASLSKDSIDAMIADARQSNSASEPGNGIDMTGSSPSLPDHDEELRLQVKYFSGTDEPSQHCLSCSGVGHSPQACPELSCRFCESKGHISFGCPTRRRCDKCRQIGHSVDTCQEKLALAPDELDGCAFCNADHEDQDCSEIWRSFKPSELNVKKVKSIPAFCYTCGGENHYGPECSLSEKGGKAANHATWSKVNRDLYIDPESEDVAIAWIGVNTSQLTREEFHVPGRATRKTHTYFVSSDESDEDLIHAPIKKPQARADIRIASNIGTMNGNSRGRGGGYKSWQPPLPPGPPPPLAESVPKKPLQSASPGTLPPRPQAFAPGKPSGRGRGGYRGRGRSRGRGRGT
ncbi:hypothetical protein O1611_g9019 [Lasiodiplodia mahajangana]|uniref:Uncharacterized protein n=1 Tax=Lasiodiplodia mahajangana TaxID=1108764 RepID=A0ACC2JB64_9PEZI|nr:hypothetical protein O1611_g9019 [Lasiodiplodia mahajangana]